MAEVNKLSKIHIYIALFEVKNIYYVKEERSH